MQFNVPVACELLLYLEKAWSKFCLVLGFLFPYHVIFRNYPGKNEKLCYCRLVAEKAGKNFCWVACKKSRRHTKDKHIQVILGLTLSTKKLN